MRCFTARYRCHRCGGYTYPGYQHERYCLWCGEVEYPANDSPWGDLDLATLRLSLRVRRGRPPRAGSPNSLADGGRGKAFGP